MKKCVIDITLDTLNAVMIGLCTLRIGIKVTHISGISEYPPNELRLSLSGEGLPEKFNWNHAKEILHANLSDIFQR